MPDNAKCRNQYEEVQDLSHDLTLASMNAWCCHSAHKIAPSSFAIHHTHFGATHNLAKVSGRLFLPISLHVHVYANLFICGAAGQPSNN